METPQSPVVPPTVPPVAPQTCPLAVWSLVLAVLGACCLFLFGSIPAVICGHMALARIKASDGALTGEGLAIAGLALGYVGMLLGLLALVGILAGLLLPAVAGARGHVRRAECANNLRQFGRTCMMYAGDAGAIEGNLRFPADLKTVAEQAGAGAEKLFVSPGSGTVPGPMDKVDRWSDYRLVPGHTANDPRDLILAFSRPHCHAGRGGNVLYTDISVRWLPKEDYDQAVAPFLAEGDR